MVSIIHSRGDRSLKDLVDLEKGIVAREIYVNEAIYQQELEQIYTRAWLFIGHESQVPNPGDFVMSRMGEEEVLLVRDRKNQLHVFLNTCRHRGMKVCRYDDGNTLIFTCPFHGWSYDTDGSLVGVPHHKAAFHEELIKADWGLHEVAQMANYHGSIWATWDAKAPSFVDYMGVFAPTIQWCFQSTDGEDNGVELFNPATKWRIPTNWKFPGFSFDGDSAHAAMTHRSVNVAAIGPQGDMEGGSRAGMKAPFPKTSYEMMVPELGHGGHNYMFDQPGVSDYADTWQTEPKEVDEYYRETRAKKQAKYKDVYLHGGDGGTALIWPNVNIQPHRILIWHPHGVGVTESWRQYPVDKNAPKVVKDAQRRYMMRYGGPTGVTESDDMENWNYAFPASLGTVAQRLPYNFQMGLGHDFKDDRLPGMTFNYRIAEENQRARLRRWVEFMEAGSWDEIYPVNPKKNTDK
jgi:phenylpropionate dioxygenase-like ring-hydroxylating dioxygenase large terminal subunit